MATTGAWSELGWFRRALGPVVMEGSGSLVTASTAMESVGLTSAVVPRLGSPEGGKVGDRERAVAQEARADLGLVQRRPQPRG